MIYAVNSRSKQHKVMPDDFSQDARLYIENGVRWDIIRADADGWIEWDGDDNEECPLPEDCPVEVKRRGPDMKVMQRERAASLAWQDIGSDFTITAYRPILEANPRTPMPEQGTDATTPRRPFLDSGRLRERFGPFDVSPPAWDGEELPPVGCECECYIPSRGAWAKVKIVAHDGDVAIFKNGVGHLYAGALSDQFRPIRSEEDKAVEAMQRITADAGSVEGGFRALYRAGYKKE